MKKTILDLEWDNWGSDEHTRNDPTIFVSACKKRFFLRKCKERLIRLKYARGDGFVFFSFVYKQRYSDFCTTTSTLIGVSSKVHNASDKLP